ncbi:hypothetical protein BGZ61DRAFT_520143 [Ilyonectria robusta]|uniref:uncharacterized protein n=1 Tax=Ilyonectria robusta TaxID=1079257 RepID=UPI001E8D8660|nr:uncharacterized protein BGZ61DRAFT_520143 [Ilyonectria robusta]KAH8680306.1 hypothetical protein BGZ61DRAFT_520143 [Ilyonectria robusta]
MRLAQQCGESFPAFSISRRDHDHQLNTSHWGPCVFGGSVCEYCQTYFDRNYDHDCHSDIPSSIIVDSPPPQIAHNERDFVDPHQILAEGTRYENPSPASSHLMVYPASLSTEDTSLTSTDDSTPISIEDNTPMSTEDTTPLSSAYTTPRSAPASQHSENSLNPRSCGCTETLLSKMSKKDREKHEISKAHRPDLYGKTREEAPLGTHQCCCGDMVPRRDNHKRHVET